MDVSGCRCASHSSAAAIVVFAALAWYPQPVLTAEDAGEPVQQIGFARAVDMLQAGRDTAKAIRTVEEVARQGDARAQVLLAGMYFDGNRVPPDPVVGYAWAQVATSTESYFREDTSNLAQDMLIAYGARMTGPQLMAAETLAARMLAEQRYRLDHGTREALRARYTTLEPAKVLDGIRFPETVIVKVADSAGVDPTFRPGCALAGATQCPASSKPRGSGQRCTGTILEPDSDASTVGADSVRQEPAYPFAAGRLGLEGKTYVLLHVDGSGWVCGASVAVSSGATMLDQAAVDSVRTWKLAPATRAGERIESLTLVGVTFRIPGYVFKR